MVGNEWKHLINNKIMLLVLLVILAIPAIYTTLFLGSMWDPYGQLDQLPVAVVNLDQQAGYNEQQFNVGDQLIENLKQNESLKFDFVDAKTARAGLAEGQYYMVITIPADFSGNAATLMDEKPQRMVLEYETNPGHNYIASKMSESAMARIKDSVAAEVTKTYAQVMFEQIGVMAEGMQAAAEGAGSLKDGIDQIREGNGEIADNLETLSEGTVTFQEGSETLSAGVLTYTQGVDQVNSGAGQLGEGAGQLDQGLKELSGKVPELTGGAKQLNSGAKKLAEGSGSALSGAKQLKSGAALLDKNMLELKQGLTKLKDGTKDLPTSAAALDTGAKQLSAGAGQLQEGIGVLSQGADRLVAGVGELQSGLQILADTEGQEGAGTALYNGYDQLERGIMAILGVMPATADEADPAPPDNSGIKQQIDGIAAYADTVREQAAAAAAVTEQLGAVNEAVGTDDLDSQLEAAIAADDPEALQAVAAEAISRARQNYNAAESLGNIGVDATAALGSSSANLSAAADVMAGAAGLSGQLDALSASSGQAAYSPITQQLVKAALRQYRTAGLEPYVNGVKTAKAGCDTLAAGVQGDPEPADQASMGLTQGIAAISGGIDELKTGLEAMSAGTGQLNTGTPELVEGITAATSGSARLQSEGTAVIKSGSAELYKGLGQLNSGSRSLSKGTGSLVKKLPPLVKGVKQLKTGAEQLDSGAQTLLAGTDELARNSGTLRSGAEQLAQGAARLSGGAGALAAGAGTLGEGLDRAAEGGTDLSAGLSDGAAQVGEISVDDANLEMFADPVAAEETTLTEIQNNGHAMAAYMMSVGLWVACIAFCLMYPLTAYKGRLKSGFAWWFSKATVIYPLAVLMALVMNIVLQTVNGFAPAEQGKTLLAAVMAAAAFMSIMYFFNVWLGKIGSFLMLIFMVVQLAGSAGTYPIELSGSFVSVIHKWLPFSYTVEAFRATISGSGSIRSDVLILAAITLIFSILTIALFRIRAGRIKKGKGSLYDLIEKQGLA